MCNFLINILKEIIPQLSILILGGLLGFEYWKKQIKGQKKYESALVFLEELHNYYYVLQIVRDKDGNPLGKPESKVYEERWNIVLDVEKSLKKREITIRLLFGEEKEWQAIEKHLETIFIWRKKLLVNINRHLENKENKDIDILYGNFSKEDTFDVTIKKEIDQIEQKLKSFSLK